MRWEVRLSGKGGQGLILAGLVLSEAALRAGYRVAMSQSYGPQARGGTSRSEVVMADEEIYYPRVVSPHILLLMSQEACRQYGRDLRPGGTVIVDSSQVEGYPEVEGRVIELPITRLAREGAKANAANMVALGVLGGATGLVSLEDLKAALLARVPPGTEELNQKALELGWMEGERTRKG